MSFYGHKELQTFLGISAPLLMLDRLSVSVSENTAVGLKQVSMQECQFMGHFPGNPIMPGVLQIAAMCQAATALFAETSELPAINCIPTALRRVKFRKPVTPGDSVAVTCTGNNGQVGEYTVKLTVDGDIATSGIVTVAAKDASWWNAPAEAACPQECGSSPASWLGTKEIMGIIPHRAPFVLLDKMAAPEDLANITGRVTITGNSPWVNASAIPHFPGYLQLESCAQLACAALLNACTPENRPLGVFMGVDEAVFNASALPGDSLQLQCTCDMMGRYGIVHAAARSSKSLLNISEATFKLALLN